MTWMKASTARRTTIAGGERQRFVLRFRGWLVALALMVGFTATASAAQEPSIALGPLQRCVTSGGHLACRLTAIDEIDLADPIVHVRQVIDVPSDVADSRLPLAVALVGTMSSEVRWNGKLVGRNGVVGPDAASETPGRFHAVMPVPREDVRLGRNVVDIRMSAHHRWLPVRMPVQQIRVGYYTGSSTGELGAYWPALLTVGTLLLAALYFGATALLEHARRDALILASVGISAAVQLAIETSRSFVDYAYPWHVVRISAIVIVASLTSALMACYAARRFAPRRTLRFVAVSVAISVAAMILVPSFDAKAWISLFAAAVICLVCAAHARGRRDGRAGMVVSGLFGLMLLSTSQDALDRGYYLFVAALLAGLVAEQVIGQRRLHSGLAAERERGNTLAERLAAAEHAGTSIISFRDGAKIHRVPEREIVRIAAADDFCELVLTGRGPLLVGGTLKSLATSLPAGFLRVHKSHVVNLAHVTAVNPKPGGGHQLVLDDGSSTPVGRTYRDVLLDRLRDRRAA